MNKDTLILLSDFTASHGIDSAFIITLEEYGLIRTVTIEKSIYIEIVELPRLEKFTRLHQELEINIPGIEAVTNLLDRIDELQGEIALLERRLRLYE